MFSVTTSYIFFKRYYLFVLICFRRGGRSAATHFGVILRMDFTMHTWVYRIGRGRVVRSVWCRGVRTSQVTSTIKEGTKCATRIAPFPDQRNTSKGFYN